MMNDLMTIQNMICEIRGQRVMLDYTNTVCFIQTINITDNEKRT